MGKRERRVRRRGRRAFGLSLLVLLCAACAGHASPTSSSSAAPPETANSTPAPTSTSVFEGWQHPTSSVRVGAPNSSTKLDVLLALPLQDANRQEVVQSVSEPDTAGYRQYETVPWVASHAGANGATIGDVLDYLRSQGVAGHLDPTASYVEAVLSVRQASKLFRVQYGMYRTTDDGTTTLAAPASEPQLPHPLVGSVALVLGSAGVLSAAPVRPPPLRTTPTTRSLLGTSFGTMGTPGGCPAGSHVSGGSTKLFTPRQYLTAYGVESLRDEGVSGAGQTIAIWSGVPGRQKDLATFTHCFGLSTPQIHDIPIGLGTRASLKFALAHDEVSLDTEMVAAMAPRLSGIDVINTPGEDSAVGIAELLDAPLDRSLFHGPMPKVVSISLGFCEVGGSLPYAQYPLAYALDEHLLMDAAANGISTVNSSGDSGSLCNLAAPAHRAGARLSVQFPSSSPFVTAAGGALLGLNTDDSIKSEEAWNDLSLGLGVASAGARARCSPVPGTRRAFRPPAMIVWCPMSPSRPMCSIRSPRTARPDAPPPGGNPGVGRVRPHRFSQAGSPWRTTRPQHNTRGRSGSSTRSSTGSARNIRARSSTSPMARTMSTGLAAARLPRATTRPQAGDR